MVRRWLGWAGVGAGAVAVAEEVEVMVEKGCVVRAKMTPLFSQSKEAFDFLGNKDIGYIRP